MKDLRLELEAYREQTVRAVRLYDSTNQYSPGERYTQLSVYGTLDSATEPKGNEKEILWD